MVGVASAKRWILNHSCPYLKKPLHFDLKYVYSFLPPCR
jgi:hypothetical protein